MKLTTRKHTGVPLAKALEAALVVYVLCTMFVWVALEYRIVAQDLFKVKVESGGPCNCGELITGYAEQVTEKDMKDLRDGF
ncbi:hypothetical protein HQ560_02795 [bacterium]|nr:hypothetical protein [bacterium]